MAGNGRGPLSVHGAPISSMQILGGDPLPRVSCTGRPWFPFLRGSSAATPRMSSSWLADAHSPMPMSCSSRRCLGPAIMHTSLSGALAMNRRSVRGQHHVTTWDSGRGQVVLNGDWWPSLSPVGTPLLLPACCLRRLEGLVHLPSLQTVAQLGAVDRDLTHGS